MFTNAAYKAEIRSRSGALLYSSGNGFATREAAARAAFAQIPTAEKCSTYRGYFLDIRWHLRGEITAAA